jgi:[ribosomal protein S5]-alanine N-acetyltransferase
LNSELETQRLILRPLTSDDFEAVHSWASNPANTRYMGWGPNNEAQTRAFLASACPGKDFGIVLKASGRLIGSGGIYPDKANDTAEIGWILHMDFWKHGYGTEFGGELIRYGFEDLKLRRIYAPCAAVNYGSYRVMERNGMRREAVHVKAFWARVDKEWIGQAIYAILAEDYYNKEQKPSEQEFSSLAALITSTNLMFHNLDLAMKTVDWHADICGTPAWRYIYHTLHSADKFFINPSSWTSEDEPPFHTYLLDWPDTPTDNMLSEESLYTYLNKVRHKIIFYLNSLNDSQLSQRPEGCALTRLGLALSQFRHMYAHIGILNGVTIANTNRYPLVINESTWRSGNLPDGLYDLEERT